MKGNEVLAEAAMRAGCRYFFGYPITPQTELAAYMRYLSESYLSESRDQNGEVCHISLHYSEDFNWAYDVVDNIAETEPDRPAMMVRSAVKSVSKT